MNISKTILIIDNEYPLTNMLEDKLDRNNIHVLVARKGRQALEMICKQRFDLIVLDTALPDMKSYELCRRLRQDSPVPIIIVTGRKEEGDLAMGLESGADAYLYKPFGFRELLACINAIFRRIAFSRTNYDTHIQIGDVLLDTSTYKIYKRKKALTVTQKEYQLLYALMSCAGHVVSRSELMDKVWGVNWLGDTRTLDVHIRWVREKIEEFPSRPYYIQTVRGVGYRFAMNEEAN